jgi:hypothetical protein
MGKAWRWDKQSFKRTVIDTVLDKVIRDLFGDNDRPRQRKAGGGVSPRKKPRRQSFSLEAIEPRLLLSADIAYASGANNFTLRAEGTNVLHLYDISNNSVAQQTLTDGSVTIERASLGEINADTIHLDLDSFHNLDGFINSHGNTLSITFDGGDQRLSKDKITLDGATGAIGYSLSVLSNSEMSSMRTLPAISA